MILLPVAFSARNVSERSLNKGSVLDSGQLSVDSVPRPASGTAGGASIETRRYQHLVLGTAFLVAIAPSYGRSLPSVGCHSYFSTKLIWCQSGPQNIQNWG